MEKTGKSSKEKNEMIRNDEDETSTSEDESDLKNLK